MSAFSSRASAQPLVPNTWMRQIHRRGPYGCEQAGRAASELHQRRRDIPRIGGSFLRVHPRIYFGDRSGQIDESIQHVQPCAGHPAARGLARIIAPAALHARRMLVAEIALDMKNFAERPAATIRLISRMHGKQRLLLPSANGTPAFSQAPIARSASARVSAKGFSHQTGLPAAATAEICPTCSECGVARNTACTRGSAIASSNSVDSSKPFGNRKFTRKFRLFGDATDDPQASAFALYGFDNIFSPSAKTDDSSIDHGRVEEFLKKTSWEHIVQAVVRTAIRQMMNRRKPAMDDQERFERGLKLRVDMFGREAVDKRMNAFGEFGKPLQHIINAYAYGDVWQRSALPPGVKSLTMVAMMAAAGHPNELRVHLKGAVKNGCTAEQIQEVLLLLAMYCGIPAANEAHRIAAEVLGQAAN